MVAPDIDDASSNEISDSDEDYIPVCDDANKPFVGRKFPTLHQAEQFYKSYGRACGFDVRLGQIKRSPDDTIIQRYVYCNREGVKSSTSIQKNNSGSFRGRKKRVSTRVDCKAKVIIRFCGSDGYVVDVFDEGHKHAFVSESYRHFMKCNRSLDNMQQQFILNCQKANVGTMKSFRLFKEIVGSYKYVGCSSTEFKNFTRDLRAYVEGVDAQILLNKFHNKREIFPDFKFDYCVNESEKLTRLFWADPVSIKMNSVFGEAVSFDATYSSNKYNMIFTPFTGKDNHGRCVTFAAGLLSREDVDSYVWILQKFVDCMKIKPNMIITDQDPALKIAVERVMPATNHRFCMWHIMLKVAGKIPVSLTEDEGFAKKFNELVWSESIEPNDFDINWHDILDEYGLSDHEWFATMFELRDYWIPAYFKNVAMSGLFRTTSMSESENSFFRRYNNKNANLLHFMMHFDSAIDAQRDNHDKMSSIDESSTPEARKECLFERHAATIYTANIFDKVQNDIKASAYSCGIVNVTRNEVVSTYDIEDIWLNRTFRVTVSGPNESFDCECNHFFKHGLFCRHIYVVFTNLHVRKIPSKYIVPRWTKYACAKDIMDKSTCVTDSHNEKIYLLSQLHDSASISIGNVVDDVDRMKELLKDFKDLNLKHSKDGCASVTMNGKQKVFENHFGASIPTEISVLPPDPIKTKGSGSSLQSRSLKAMKKANKKKRLCSKCKKMVNHDARNCPLAE